MRVFFALLLLISLRASAQKKDIRGEGLLKQAQSYYEGQSYVRALNIYDKIIKERDSVSPAVYAKALFGIPKIYMQTGRKKEAREAFTRVLSSDVNDNDSTAGDELNAYGNFKHSSALFLAQLCYNDSDHAGALNWLCQADTLYPYYASPENPTAAVKSAAGILGWEQSLLERLGRTEDVIQRTVYELICAQQFAGYFGPQQNELFRLIEKDKAVFKRDFDAALDSVKIIPVDNTHQQALMIFKGRVYKFDITSELPHSEYIFYHRLFVLPPDKRITAQGFSKIVKNNIFYKRLAN